MVHLYKHIIKHLVQRTVCIFIFIFKQGRHTIIKSERMADEAAPRPNQGFVVRKLVAVNPTFDTVKTFPQGIIELALRGAAVILASVSIICAATCQAILRKRFLENMSEPVLETNISLTAGWVIFLSFWVAAYQIVAIIQLFLHARIVYTIIPLINWSIFFLVDIIAIGIAAGGYFCGAVAMTVHMEQSSRGGNISYNYSASAGATAAFSFLSMLLSVGMIGYFLMARYVLKWSTHGRETAAGKKTSSSQSQQVDE